MLQLDFTRVNEEATLAKADPAGGVYLFSFASAGKSALGRARGHAAPKGQRKSEFSSSGKPHGFTIWIQDNRQNYHETSSNITKMNNGDTN